MITPTTLLTAMRKNIKQADVMFTQGKCYQLYLMLSDLYPQAVAWYEPVDSHVFTEIDGKFYDINGEYESISSVTGLMKCPRKWRKKMRLRWKHARNNPSQE